MNIKKSQGWEEKAKWAEEMGIPELAKAMRNKDLQNSCEDIHNYDGWIRVKTSVPEDSKEVLVTNGESVWIGDYNSKRQGNDKWSVVFDGAPPFQSCHIIAWMFMPYVPKELKEEQ